MSLDPHITRLPRAHEPDLGQEALTLTPWADGDTARLIHGATGSSPYLASLLRKEADWLEAALAAPEAALDGLPEDGDPASPLRQAKRRVALLAGLCDLGGIWPLDQVTGALTRLASGPGAPRALAAIEAGAGILVTVLASQLLLRAL